MKLIITSCFVLLFLLNQFNSYGQIDSLMTLAKELIKQDKNKQAEQIYTDFLKQNPGNNDVRLALGLLYSWTKQYDKARVALTEVIKARPQSKETYIAAINNELWADNYSAALALTLTAAVIIKNDADILIREAKALLYLEKQKEAQQVVDSILVFDPNNSEAQSFLKTLKWNNQKNAIGVNYSYDYFFSIINPWHLASIQYKRKTNIGAVIGRINYAQRFDTSGYQAEIDAYPSLGKKSYAYVNVGYSNKALFPTFRMGFDYNRKLPKAFETSLGFRYLNFSGSEVYIFTGHLGKYLGNYWFSLRPFVVPDKKNASISGFFALRRYFSNAENYIGAQIGYGSSPDDYNLRFTGRSNLRLNEAKVKLTYNHLFGIHWIINSSVGYAKEEYFTALYRDHVTIDVSMNYLF